MRAGLLSDPKIISLLNKRFVCTTVIIDDVRKQAESGDSLAKLLTAHWKYPLELMFLTPDPRLVSKLNSFADFPEIHPDVSAPRRNRPPEKSSHVDVFLKHIAQHFGES